jgi:hypothetical protein
VARPAALEARTTESVIAENVALRAELARSGRRGRRRASPA